MLHEEAAVAFPDRIERTVEITAPPIALAATLGLAAASWAVAAWLMDGMDMGLATQRGTFGFFAAAWLTMMAAMLLPGAAPAVARRARVTGKVRAALQFAGFYLVILYVVACGARPAADLPEFVAWTQEQGWDTCVVVTLFALRFADAHRLAELTGHPVRSEYKLPEEPDVLPVSATRWPSACSTRRWAAGRR